RNINGGAGDVLEFDRVAACRRRREIASGLRREFERIDNVQQIIIWNAGELCDWFDSQGRAIIHIFSGEEEQMLGGIEGWHKIFLERDLNHISSDIRDHFRIEEGEVSSTKVLDRL